MVKNNADHRRQEVQQVVKNACDQMRNEGQLKLTVLMKCLNL